MNCRAVIVLTHVAEGAASHVTPAHGSGRHAPAAQPYAHVSSLKVYWHTPFMQLPLGAYVRSLVPSTHVAAGGALQLTPLHDAAAH